MGCYSSSNQDSDENEPEEKSEKKCALSPKESTRQVKEISNIWKIFMFRKNLGTGASCQVCLVQKRATNVNYALKMIDFKYEKLWRKELDTLQTMDCPNIVRIEGGYRDKRMQYICMEYCSGKSLFDRLSKEKKYNEGVAANCAKEMLQAIKYLHDLNIVHRDIKPANFVFLTEDSYAGIKLLDFGLAIPVNPSERYSYRSGTPYFMAPELVQNVGRRSADVCKASDMWALGVCIFVMLNGKLPFKGQDRSELFYNIIHQKNIKFRTKGLSLEAKQFVFQLLARNAPKRLSVDDALKHPWIVKSGMNENEILQSTVDSLRLFNAKHSVHRALQRLASKKVTTHDKEYFKQLFDRFDKNGDGHISRDECIAALEGSLMYTNEAVNVADEMIKHADDNHDDKISWDEFQHAIARRDLTNNEYKMHAVFSALDVNRDGYISSEELVYCLQSEEWQAEDESLKIIIDVFQNAADEYGHITFDHFRKLLTDPKVWESTFKSLDSGAMMEVLNDNVTFIDEHQGDVPIIDLTEPISG